MGGYEREFVARLTFRYAWKFTELLTLLILARMLNVEQFGLGFFSLTMIYFLISLVKFCPGNKENKQLYNTLSVVAPIVGFSFLGVLFVISIFLSGQTAEAMRLAAVIVMFSSFVITPEIFYRQHSTRIYKSYTLLQAFTSAVALVLAYLGFGYKAIAIPYILFYLGNTFILWSVFPIDLEPRVSTDVLREIFTAWKSSVPNNLVASLVAYGPLLLTGILFGMGSFAFLYLAYCVGFFLYENITLFLNSSIAGHIRSDEPDALRVSMLHITEYVSFVIVPLSLVPLMLARDISVFMIGPGWSILAEPMIFLLLSGLLKGISEVGRIALMVKSRHGVIHRIRLFELFFLFTGLLTLPRVLGLAGIGISILIASAASAFLYITVTARMTGISMINSRDYLYILFSAVLTMLGIGLVKEFAGAGSAIITLFYLLTGVVFYVSLTFFFNRDFYRRFVRFAFSLVER